MNRVKRAENTGASSPAPTASTGAASTGAASGGSASAPSSPKLPGAGGAIINSLNTPNPNQGWWGATKAWAGRNIATPLVYGLEYSGVGNALKGISTTARGAANAAAGTIGAGLGAVGGGLATAGGYATDAVGLTENAGQNNWEGTKAFVGSMGNAAMQGAKDTLGGAADTATLGLYNYDGTLLDPKQTAVQNMHNEHVQQLGGPDTAAAQAYGWSTGIGEAAADIAGMSGAGTAVGAATKGLRAAAGVAPAAAAASKTTSLLNTPLSQVPQTLANSTPLQAAGLGAGAVLESKAIEANKNEILNPVELFPDADDDQLAQINQAGEQLSTLPPSQKQMAGMALSNPKSQEAQQLASKGQQNYIAENMSSAPSDPQQFGGFMNTMLGQFNAMPMEAKIGMGLGLAGGLMSLMQGLNSGGIGNFLLGALGIGGAGALAAGGGMLGSGAQKLVGDAALGIGKSMGMNIPEKMDLSALVADDPIAAARAQGGKNLGFFSSSEDLNAAVSSAEAKKQQLAQLQSVPAWLRPTVLQSLDPENIKSVEDANLAAANAQQVYNQMNDPESAVNQDLNNARWAANFSVFKPSTWRGQKKTSAAFVRGINKYAFNAVDAKELNDLKTEQSKKYDLDNARRLNELAMRKQHATVGENSSACSPRATMVRGPVVRSVSITVLRKAARCWSGYEPVPGAKPYSRGSCRPVGSKKTQKEMKQT